MRLNNIILLAAAAGSAVASPFKHAKRASSFECMYSRGSQRASGLIETHEPQGSEQANLARNLARAISLVSG